MKVRDVMTSPAITVSPDTPFGDVVDTLLVNDISGVPVIDDAGRLIGIVTEADLVSEEAYGDRKRRTLRLLADHLRGREPRWVRSSSNRTARDVMTVDPLVVAADDDLSYAAQRMLDGGHKRLPVVSDGRVVGIISRQDLLTSLGRRGGDEEG